MRYSLRAASPTPRGGGWIEIYALIESITLDEDVASVVRTAEPDNTALRLNHLYIKLTSPAYTEARRVYIAIGNTESTDIFATDKILYVHNDEIINTTGMHTEIFCTNDHGIFIGYVLPPANVNNMILPYTIHSNTRTGPIQSIHMLASGNTTDLIPAGTKIEIYGVRA